MEFSKILIKNSYNSHFSDVKVPELIEQPSNLQTPQLQLLSQSKITSLALTPSKFLPSVKSNKDRIGILRRTEGIAPGLDNTLVSQTPILANIKSSHIFDSGASPAQPMQNKESIFGNESSRYDLGLKVPQTAPLKSSLFNEMTPNPEQHWHQTEPFLEQNMEMDEDRNRNSYQGDEDEHKVIGENVRTPKKEIPFWLRPTPVQPYPYNFIMAVRKKLESITHPVFQMKQQHPYQQPNQQVSVKQPSPYQSPIARPDTRFVSQYRRNFDRQPSESESMSENVKSSDVSPLKTSNDVEYSEGQEEQDEHEEYSMNFSSATKESMRDRSDILSKSKRKSIRASQDTLSISSGILSHSSPEKKVKTTTSNGTNGTNVQEDDEERPPSPLTTDNVDGLHITSLSRIERTSNASGAKSRQSLQSMQSSRQSTQSSKPSMGSTLQSTQDTDIVSHINFSRGKDFSRSSQLSLSKLSKQKSVEELLRDFTSSLSQVIEVNQRLHHVLSNPPTSSRESKYTDDFENATDNRQTEISEHISGTHDSTSVPSYKTQHTSSTAQSNGQYIGSRNGDSTEIGRTEVSQSRTTSGDNVIEELSGVTSNEMSILSSTRNQIKSTYSIDLEESQGGRDNQSVVEPSSHLEKESSTLIEEKVNDYQSSESPTNNDLKSVSLSIAKKSAATSDDTDQPSNAIGTFSKQITGEPDVANESIGSDIFNIFNKTAMNLGEDVNTSIWSEHNISYSTLGVVIYVFCLSIFNSFSYFIQNS